MLNNPERVTLDYWYEYASNYLTNQMGFTQQKTSMNKDEFNKKYGKALEKLLEEIEGLPDDKKKEWRKSYNFAAKKKNKITKEECRAMIRARLMQIDDTAHRAGVKWKADGNYHQAYVFKEKDDWLANYKGYGDTWKVTQDIIQKEPNKQVVGQKEDKHLNSKTDKNTKNIPALNENEKLREEIKRLNKELTEAHENQNQSWFKGEQNPKGELEKNKKENENLKKENDRLQKENENLKKENDRLAEAHKNVNPSYVKQQTDRINKQQKLIDKQQKLIDKLQQEKRILAHNDASTRVGSAGG
jgi:hypothetical protein